MSIREVLEDTKKHLRDVRSAIQWRGGRIDPLAGMKDLPEAIYSIPADAALTTVYSKAATDVIAVPDRTTGIACLTAFGGLSVRDTDKNALESHRLLGLRSLSGGEELGSFTVPEAILSLDGYGDGIDLTCYNRVDTVGRKYIRWVTSFTLDGSEVWRNNGTQGTSTNIFVAKIGEKETYQQRIGVCDHYEFANVTSQNNFVGVSVYDSRAFDGFVIAIRPREDMTEAQLTDWKETLAKDPVTVKVALLEPIETDISDILPDLPLFPVESGGYVEFGGDYIESGMPCPPTEVAFSCYTE